jgi:hypothetical protein
VQQPLLRTIQAIPKPTDITTELPPERDITYPPLAAAKTVTEQQTLQGLPPAPNVQNNLFSTK